MIDILPQRLERFQEVISRRQYDLTVVLEDVHDPHNIGAVLRTCDSVGINEIYVIYTDPRLQKRGLLAGHKSSSGARQWIDIHYFEDVDDAFGVIKSKYDKIYGTKLDEHAVDLYDLTLTGSVALVFGNEHAGLTEAAMAHLTGNFIIPQHGFVQSLNISVACAVSIYEAQRQRLAKDMYGRTFGDHERDAALLDRYQQIHSDKKLRGK